MRFTDSLISMYIRNILIPRTEDYSKPGYVYTRLTSDSQKLALRDVFIPEDFISTLEAETIKKYGQNGRKNLYEIGKNSGYTYAKFSKLENINTKTTDSELEEYLRLLLLYIAGTYGADIDYEINLKEKVFKQSYSDFVVCPTNGIGEIVISGSAAGIWSWILQDKTIEAIQSECIGRGDKRCTVLLGPPDKLDSFEPKPIRVPELIDLELTDDYLTLNKSHPTEFVKNSLERLIDNQVLLLNAGRVTFSDIKFFELDIHYIYLLELLHIDQDMLFNIVKTKFRHIGDEIGGKLSEAYISELLGAMGWGDIGVYDDKILINFYPYSTLYSKTSFTVIRGIMSGLLQSLRKTEINFLKATPNFDSGWFSLVIE
jgi:hypothetical protein